MSESFVKDGKNLTLGVRNGTECSRRYFCTDSEDVRVEEGEDG